VFISTQPFLLFVEYFMNKDSLATFAPFEELTFDRMINSFVLSNVVSIVCMIFLLRLSRTLYINKNSTVKKIHISLMPYWMGVAISIVGLVWYLNSSRGQLILNYGFDNLGSYNDYYKLRYESGLQRYSVIEQYIYVLSVSILIPLLTLYSLQNFLRDYDKKWIILWFMNLCLWILAAVIAYAKSPIIAVVISNFALLALHLQKKHISGGIKVIFGVASILICIYAMYLVTSIAYGSNDVYDVMNVVADRFISIPMSTAYNHFYVFPDVSRHTYYSNSRSLNIILGGGYFVNTGGLQTFEIASYYLFGLVFNMNTGFVAAGWAELGYIGVFQVSVIIFGILLFWDVYLLHTARYVSIDALLVFFIGRLWQINNGDMMFLLIPGGFIFAPLIYLFLCQRRVFAHKYSKDIIKQPHRGYGDR
jgi:hypothetical protein